RFSTATSHGFFLWIDARDKKFEEGSAAGYFESIGAGAVESIHEETEGRDIPGIVFSVGAIATAIALVPPMWIAAAAGQSSQPRLSIWWCMDYQPKYKAQSTTSQSLFADGRSMRLAVPGTVARGTLREDLRYFRGLNSEGPATTTTASRDPEVRYVNLLQEAEGADNDPAPAAEPEKDWVTDFPEPFEVTAEMMDRGQERFNVNCATCHGWDGRGKGLATVRAEALGQTTWAPPISLHSSGVAGQPIGKLFHSITNGVRRMPAYGRQISVEDRWAIVLYLRALQRQGAATADDLPQDVRQSLEAQ
ncbi:MAG: cytochrome c, partial [Planctomycetota bacterium]